MSVILRPDFPKPPTSEGAEAPIRLLCKTLERAALTKEQRFRAWLGQNPCMERNPYARQWFENAEAKMAGYDPTKEYEAQGKKQYGERR